MMHILMTFGVALLGAYIAKKLEIPAGGMIGSMLAVALFNIIFDVATFPSQMKVLVQTISGVLIGCKITKSELVGFKKLLKPSLINIIMLFSGCLTIGWLMYKFTDYALVTSAFATAPGGLMDMVIISMDMGADTAVVSILQVVRLLSILSLFPTLFKVIIQKVQKKYPTTVNNLPVDCTIDASDACADKTLKNMAITLIIGTMSGLIGFYSGIPAGTLMFSMLGVGIQNVWRNSAYVPVDFKFFAQTCGGALIGVTVNRSLLLSLQHAILPAILMVVGMITIVLVLAFILYRTSDLDFPTAMFACAPGGASDLALIAEEFGANAPQVSIIQSVRLVLVVMIYPTAISFLL